MKIDLAALPLSELAFWSRVLKRMQFEFGLDKETTDTFENWVLIRYDCKLCYSKTILAIAAIEMPEQSYSFLKLKFSN